MSAVDELITWLRAQLDEDERVAIAIQGDRYGDNDDGRWRNWTIEEHEDRHGPYLSALGVELVHSYADNVITPQRGEHIARWDPARVLAEVKAKRRILDEHAYAPKSDSCRTCWRSNRGGTAREASPCPTVRLLAQPYAGRDGWQESWRATPDS